MGNETIRFRPGGHWVQVKLPAALSHLANRPHGRYQLSCPVDFPYRGDEVAAQAASGAIRYDVSLDVEKGRWYLDASWTFASDEIAPALGSARATARTATSKWGAQHWLAPLKQASPQANGHHAAALVIGRRGLGHRARRRERCDSTRPEDREERAADSAVHGVAAPIREPVDREARERPHPRQKTRAAERNTTGEQGGKDRSCRPEVTTSYSLPS